jgi:hypothetical protein
MLAIFCAIVSHFVVCVVVLTQTASTFRYTVCDYVSTVCVLKSFPSRSTFS